MIKTRLGQLVITLGLLGLLVVVFWVSLFFLINQDKQAVKKNVESSQQLMGGPNEPLYLSKEKVDKVGSYFLTSQTTVKLLEDLEQIGQQKGIKLTVSQANDNDNELKLNLTAVGSFSKVMDFLQSLENLPYAGRVERLELKKVESQWQGVFILRILKDKNV